MALPADDDLTAAEEDLLPAADRAWLTSRGFEYVATLDGGFINVVIRSYPIPAGYDHAESDLLVRLPATWPDGKPDMFWFDPPLTRADRRIPDRANATTVVGGRKWQRWSRHIQSGWRSGIDRLANYLAIVNRHLVDAAR